MGDAIGDLTGMEFSSSSRYTIVEEIGRGGMGIVFLAEKDCEGVVDDVVLKTLRSLSPEHEQKLKDEANIATALRHENIVKTYGLESIPLGVVPDAFRQEMDELDSQHGRRKLGERLRARKRMVRSGVSKKLEPKRRSRREAPGEKELRLSMLVMDYVDGTDLRQLQRQHLKTRRLLPCLLAGFIVSRLARALAYAHEWIVHRDISPENVLVNNQGVVKLSDFGIAVPTDGPSPIFAGKLGYMSPEQLRGDPLDGRSDIYSLGIVLYHLLTGIPVLQPPPKLPFAQALQEAIGLVTEWQPPPPHTVRYDIPEVISDLCMRMIETHPDGRIRRADDVASLLEQKYLYAEGFGPTNNSLAAYVSLFERGFDAPTSDELRQLSFLTSLDGSVHLERTANGADYTDSGRELVKEYREYHRG